MLEEEVFVYWLLDIDDLRDEMEELRVAILK
jgi:hypothetical protein